MASSTGANGAGQQQQVSMMKEILKKQLRYWVENFRDDMLPRDFGAKGFSRNTLTLHKIELKLHKVAATLQIPKPLLVTRAYCSELVIKVPSWSAADKFMQEPLSLRVVDLFLDVKSAADCDEAFLKAAEARVQAAIMEPDPLGSIASWYAFSTVISERLELLVDNVYIKVFVKGVSRIRVELTGFHSRTTNAMWQDMRDLTTCVDRSPDGLLKTRFKFVSFSCSVLLTASKSSSGDTASSSAPPLQLLHDHEVTLRMTLFGHRQSKSQSWETLSQVIDVNLHTLPFDYDIAQLLQIYEVYATVSGWIREAAAQERSAQEAGAGLPSSPSMLLHHHQIQRGQVMKTKSDDEQVDSEASFALQLTFRFTADAKLRFTSERLGKQHLALTAQHAAVNLIVQHDNVRELQITVHEVKVLFQDVLVLFLKPNRDVMQLKQLRESVFVKWHLQKLMCNIEGDLALVINEAYHAHNEKEQSAFIKCGTCLQQIRLESIETHVCGPPLSPTTARSLSDAQTSSQSERFDHGAADPGSLPGNGEKGGILDSTTIPRLRIVFALDEIELNVDSHAFHNVQQLMRSSSYNSGKSLVERKFCVQMRELSVTTEAKEFVGDAIFVPMLPLAFQMLECTLQGCGCVHKKSKTKDASSSRTNSESTRSDSGSIASSSSRRPRWPERVFVELAHLECTAKSPQLSSLASFFVAEAISVRSSFSDGAQICANCHPQLSLHASVDRIRFQVDHPAFQFIRKTLSEAHRPLQSAVIVTKTLFLAVLEIRAIEFTLLEAQASATTAARLKNLFRQVSIVGDNQLGHLALQSSLDFRSLFNSQLVRFFHRGAVAAASLMGTSASTETESSSDASQSQKTLTKTQCRRIRLEHERQSAAQVIQRLFRRHTTPRHHNKTPSAQLEATEPLTTSSHGSNGALGVHDGLENGGERCDSKAERRATKSGHLMSLVLDDEPVTLPNKRKGSHGSGSRFGVPEDLVNANRKMVAAASVITKFVKNTQQQLESEVVGLATHSKESAARLVLPGYSACKKMFGLDALSPSSSAKPKTIELIDSDLEYKTKAHELRNVDTDMETVGRRTGSASSSSRSVTMEPTESMDVIHLGDHEDERRRSHESSTRSEDEGPNGQVEKNGGAADGDDPLDTSDRSHRVDSICEESGDQNDNDDHDDQEVEETEADEEADDDGEYEGEKDDEENYSPLASQHQRQQEEEEELHTHEAEFGLDESLLATLPAVIRVLVQVGEHRVRVPINPREKVGFLCREVVRRFNETFTSSSSSSGNGNRVISHVTLQDSRGGVFAATDVVGFVYASESEVLFALPHQPDTKIRSVAHIEPSCMAPSTSSKPKRGPPKTSKLSRRVGCKFSRCSQLPLPLAIALLANENERDLMRCVLNDGSVGCGNNGSNTGKQVDEWPELALNVNFLDPKQMLPVEVRWFGSCLEVTNVDAFVLCLQQLGLCTSRPSSKHVGKILRERLKMDAKSAFIRSACLRSSEFAVSRPNEEAAAGGGEEDAPAREDRELEGLVSVSYASLKEIVQEDFEQIPIMRESAARIGEITLSEMAQLKFLVQGYAAWVVNFGGARSLKDPRRAWLLAACVCGSDEKSSSVFLWDHRAQSHNREKHTHERVSETQHAMVLQKALSFMASITPKASAASAAKDLELQTPRNGARTQEAPARLEGTGSCRAEPKRNQQEMELDDFDGGLEEEEEKTQSYESEDEDGGQVLKSELIEISLGGDEHHHSQKGPHQNGPHHVHHHHHDVRHYHSASDLETIDELIDFAKDGDLFNFRRVCETLTKRSVSPDSPGYMGWTPAHWAAREGHVHILDYLLNAGVSLDALDRKGDSLLHKAAANGQYRACQWLLQFGFNVQAKNNNGKSALDVAQEHLALAKTSEAALCEAILARENANTF